MYAENIDSRRALTTVKNQDYCERQKTLDFCELQTLEIYHDVHMKSTLKAWCPVYTRTLLPVGVMHSDAPAT